MKKIYFSLLLGSTLMFSLPKSYAQTGSVTLTPASGTSVAYPSIGAAYAAIPASPTTSYTIEILSAYTGASETYPIQLTDKGLVSGGNTITIRPAAGNIGEVIQRGTPAAGAVLQINGGDNIILDGRPGGATSSPDSYLTVNDPFSGSNSSRNIELLNGANNNIVQFINSVAANATGDPAGSRNILITGTTATTGNRNNIIQNCVVTGGLRGIQDFGTSDALANIGNIIRNNTVQNFGAIGIYAGTGQQNCTIQNNLIRLQNYNGQVGGSIVGIQQQSTIANNVSNITDNTISLATSSSVVTAVFGIYDVGAGTENILRNTISTLSAPFPNSTINNFVYGIVAEGLAAANGGKPATYNISANKVSGLSSPTAAWFYGMALFPFAGSTVNINNNFVSIMSQMDARGIFGILAGNNGNNYNTNLYFNSIRIGGVQNTGNNGWASGIFKENANASSSFTQKDNIAINERVGGGNEAYFTGFWLYSTAGTLNIDYNTYYAPAGYAAGGFNGYIYPSSEAGLAEYKASAGSNEQNSNFRNVSFVSDTDLHLSGASLTDAQLLGNPIPGITTDIDGNPRNSIAPTKGGDESPAIMPVEISSFTGENKGKYNQLNWTTLTENNNRGYMVEQSANGRGFKTIGFVKSVADNGSSTSRLTYSFNDHNPVISGSYYRLRQLDKDGRGIYSAVIKIKGGAARIEITKLYPNPVVNSFNLVVNAPTASALSIAITDMSGRTLISKSVAGVAGNNIIPVNSSSLSAGTYLLSVRNAVLNEIVTMEFVK